MNMTEMCDYSRWQKCSPPSWRQAFIFFVAFL